MSSEKNKLSGEEVGELRDAILDAYRDKGKLKMMVRIKLEKNIDEIAGGDNLQLVVFNLIEWAESQGKVKKLVEGACEENPDNQSLQDIRKKLFSFLYNIGIEDNTPIPIEKWEELSTILKKINDFELFYFICYQTLENVPRIKYLLPNEDDLIKLRNHKSLSYLKNIFLEKYTYKDKEVPNIIEFALRLAKEKEKVKKNQQEELKNWVNSVAEILGICVPTSKKSKLSTLTPTTINPYLLISVTPTDGVDKFRIQAELIINYSLNHNNIKPIPVNLDENSPHVECSWSKIINIIDTFICTAKDKFLHVYTFQNITYELKIEVFLPLEKIDTNIHFIESIRIGKNKAPVGIEYRLLVRLLDRVTDYDGGYLNSLLIRWKQLNRLEQNGRLKSMIQDEINHISQVDNPDKWIIKSIDWEDTKKLGIKVTCCLPKTDDKRQLFQSILIGGVPICLWTRRDLCNIDDNDKIDRLLDTVFFEDELKWIESIFNLRREAYKEGANKDKYLGYDIGFICDNPYRIPSYLKESKLILPGD